jgi:hypothetical protein
MIVFFVPYTFTLFGTTGTYNAIAILHTLQFTVTHALGFSALTSRILATDFITGSLSLQITHEVFFSQHNSFLVIILQLSTPKNRLIQFLCSQAHILAGWRLETRLFTSFYAAEHSLITTLHGSRRKQPVSLRRRVYCSVA